MNGRRVAVFRSVATRMWVVYCPCCAEDIGDYYFQHNAFRGAQLHAVVHG